MSDEQSDYIYYLKDIYTTFTKDKNTEIYKNLTAMHLDDLHYLSPEVRVQALDAVVLELEYIYKKANKKIEIQDYKTFIRKHRISDILEND